MRYFLTLILLSFTFYSHAQILIRNTNVVDVEKRKILAGYSVVVQDGKIISVDKDRQYKLAPGTTVIDGTGKYLIPGLVDAHVHFFQNGGIFTRPDAIDLRKYHPYNEELKWTHNNMEDYLRRYTSAGITTVIDVGSSFNFLTQRDSFTSKTYAPDIYMTGPLLTTYIPPAFKGLEKESPFIEMTSEETTRQGVRDQLPYKPDFIKIWYIVLDKDKEAGARKNLPLVQAAIDEAHKNNLRVAVHSTEKITAQLAVEAGADYLVHSVDDPIDDNFVQLLKKKGTVLCPTLIVADGYSSSFGHMYKFTSDELQLSNPTNVASILDFPWPDTALGKRYVQALSRPDRVAQIKSEDSILASNLKKLVAAGVIIAAGTDAGNIGTQHVGSYFPELKAMLDAGCSTWDILQAATINGAKALNKQAEWGSIAKNKQADLVLLNSNPVESLDNLRKIDWVINKGVALKPDSLVISTPEMLAQQQLNAYNAHDLDAFLAPYAEDVEIYTFPNKLDTKGKEAMRKNYQFVTRTPGLYCRLLNRIVQGNMVIDHEEIYITGRAPFRGVAVYVIEKGKIAKVYFPE
ncbi:MAG: amidohydrolase [Citrobacter freundii]|nr:MAG: amidohydrolase [Citrobacter freundii]